MLWLNSGCNARCGTCDIWKEAPGNALTAEEVREWSAEWVALGATTVVICGEPLLYKELWNVLDELRQRELRIDFLTNGILLARNASKVAEYADVVRVSLDGPAEAHDLSRGRPHVFNRLARGVAALNEISGGPPVDGRCAVHRRNFRMLSETIEAARTLGLRSISFSATDVHNEEAFRREGAIDDAYVDSYALTTPEVSELAEVLAQLRVDHEDDFRSGFISDSPDDLERILVGYYTALSTGTLRTVACDAPWTSMVVEYDGTIRPCFPLPAYGSRRDAESTSAVLESDGARLARNGLDVSGDATCQRCVDQSLNGRVPESISQ